MPPLLQRTTLARMKSQMAAAAWCASASSAPSWSPSAPLTARSARARRPWSSATTAAPAAPSATMPAMLGARPPDGTAGMSTAQRRWRRWVCLAAQPARWRQPQRSAARPVSSRQAPPLAAAAPAAAGQPTRPLARWPCWQMPPCRMMMKRTRGSRACCQCCRPWRRCPLPSTCHQSATMREAAAS